MTARFIVGDVFDVLATLPDDSVDLVLSSPPFLALRSYLPADHPDKGKEIGSEATPADFLDTLLDVVEACDRVLAPHGSLCFELGDTFADSGGPGGDYNPGGMREGQPKWVRPRKRHEGNAAIGAKADDGMGRPRPAGPGYPMAKSLCLIPTLFAASLAYGYNMLRPERTTPRWRIRNLVVWARPNPPVGALGDKFRPATSYLTVACKSRPRYFDLDAVRGEISEWTKGYADRYPVSERAASQRGQEFGSQGAKVLADTEGRGIKQQGAPPLDYWVIPTHPYPGSHYATFPPALCVKPIAAMSPLRVCRVCGEPSRRITETTNAVGRAMGRASWRDAPEWAAEHHVGEITETASQHAPNRAIVETLGWSDCECTSPFITTAGVYADKWRPGHVLDPFAGSGTVGAVATGHGRDATLIDLDARNADLALERVGPMFLTVEHLSSEGVA